MFVLPLHQMVDTPPHKSSDGEISNISGIDISIVLPKLTVNSYTPTDFQERPTGDDESTLDVDGEVLVGGNGEAPVGGISLQFE